MTQGLFYLSEVYFKTGLLAQTIYFLMVGRLKNAKLESIRKEEVIPYMKNCPRYFARDLSYV